MSNIQTHIHVVKSKKITACFPGINLKETWKGIQFSSHNDQYPASPLHITRITKSIDEKQFSGNNSLETHKFQLSPSSSTRWVSKPLYISWFRLVYLYIFG